MNSDDLIEVKDLLSIVFKKYIKYSERKDLIGIITEILGGLNTDLEIDNQIKLNLRDFLYEIKKVINCISHSRTKVSDFDTLLYYLQIKKVFTYIKDYYDTDNTDSLNSYISKKSKKINNLILISRAFVTRNQLISCNSKK